MARAKTSRRFLMCVNNTDYPASLEVRKVYVSVADAEAESMGLVRVFDESGEDYLYPQKLFVAIELPRPAAKAVLSATTC